MVFITQTTVDGLLFLAYLSAQFRSTYILQAGGTQTFSLLVAGVLDGLDLGGLVALVQANSDFVADSHRTVVYKTLCD